MTTLQQRIENKTMPIPECGCLIWLGSLNNRGYGQVWDRRKVVLVHRAAYELENGQIPRGLVIDHLCRVPSCCNPKHLQPVTNRENSIRGVGPTSRNAAKSHCLRGHPLTPGNLVQSQLAKGFRECATCKTAHNKARDRSNHGR